LHSLQANNADQEILFQYKLEGFDPDWSAWTPQNTKEYTNLPYGEYTFQLKARTVTGKSLLFFFVSFRIPALHVFYHAGLDNLLVILAYNGIPGLPFSSSTAWKNRD